MTKILVIDGYDEVHGAPADWKPEVNGECLGLPTAKIAANGLQFRVSAHGFSDAERRAIADGACLYVWVSNPGPHPVMTLSLSGVRYDKGEDDVYEASAVSMRDLGMTEDDVAKIDMDAVILRDYVNDLRDMTKQQAMGELNRVQATLDEEEPWRDALTIYIRHIDRRHEMAKLVTEAYNNAKANGDEGEILAMSFEDRAIDMLDKDKAIEDFAAAHYFSSVEAIADIVKIFQDGTAS